VWFWLWFGLIVAWLVSAFFLLRWLWRQAVKLGAALGRLGDATERLDKGHFAAAPIPEPSIYSSWDELLARVDARQQRIAGRRERRAARRAATYQAWSELAGWSDPQPDLDGEPTAPRSQVEAAMAGLAAKVAGGIGRPGRT
jgi:hypothetical protein